MDCNNNQRSACSCRPQMPVPPCMNTSCGGGCGGGCGSESLDIQPRPIMPLPAPSAVRPAMTPAFGMSPYEDRIGGMHTCEDRIGGMPIAMAYVPWQRWKQTYSLEQALNRGTIFPELDLPFVMGRCRG